MLKFKKHIFKNGLRLISAPSDSQTVTVIALVGAGSKYEKPSEAGLSHFLEHMFFKGTKKRPTTRHISEFLDSVGGEYNAFTDKEFTGYYAKVARQHATKAFDFVSDMLINSQFKKEEVERERGVIIEEINMYQDTPMRYVSDVFETLLYGDTPAGRLISGTKESIRKMKRQQFLDYRQKLYTADNMVVAVSGAFSDKQIKTLTEKYFARFLPGQKKLDKPATKEKQKGPQAKLHFKKTDQTHLSLGVRAYDLNHRDRGVLQVLSAILGGNMSSRLFIAVRERLSLAYYVRSSVQQYSDSGYLTIQAGCDNTKVKKAIVAILKEFKRIKREPVTAKELKKAKEYLKGQALMSLEETSETATWAAFQELMRQQVPSIKQIFSEIDKVTSHDLQRVSQDIFTNDKINLAMIGPHTDKNISKKLLSI